jgi:hypothetical protein
MMGLRYITKGIVDNEGLMPSADMGVSALGKAYLPYLRPIEYQATFMNGAGFKAAESDNKKNVAMRLNTVLWSGNEIGELLLGGYAQVSGISATKWEGETKLAGAMLGLKNSWSTVYGEYLYGTNLSGFSVGAKYSFLPSYNVFARYDSYDAKRDVANNEIQRGFYGLTYDYSSDVKFALDLQSVYGQANATVSAGTTTSIIYLHCLMNY